MQKQKVFFSNLDALRTIAFLFVFSEHVWWRAFHHTPLHEYPLLQDIFYALFANGFLGVSIFFTLSGFLITYLILTEINVKGKLDIWSFYLRRTLRIWPLYFAFVLFVFVVFPLLQKIMGIPYNNPADPSYYFTFISNFDVINLHIAGLESHLTSGITWSLAIEEQFYLIWPILFLFIRKTLFWIIFPSVIMVCLYFRYLHYNEAVFIYFHTIAVFADLAVGGLAAYLVVRSEKALYFFKTLPNGKRLIVYLVGFLYIILHVRYNTHVYASVYSRLISTLYFAFIILDQNFNESARFKLGNIRLLTFWGKYTYGLYLLHPIGFWIVTLFIDYFDLVTQSFITKTAVAATALVITCLISYISYHWFERPFLNLKEKFSYISK